MRVKRRRKKFVVFSILAAAAVFLFLAGFCLWNRTANNGAIAIVNGDEITQEEFAYFISKDKAEVVNEYLASGDRTVDEAFWLTPVDGEAPAERLKERALEDCVAAKLQLKRMKEAGIYEDISFAALRQLAQDYNQQAAAAEEVYGLRSIDMDQFYSYWIDTGVLELKNILAQGELEPTEQEVKDTYEQMKREAAQETITVQLVQVPQQDNMAGTLSEIAEKARSGENLKILLEQKGLEEYLSQVALLETQITDKTGEINQVVQQAFTLQQGEVGEVFSYRGMDCLMKCEQRQTEGWYTFEEAEQVAREQAVSNKYDAMLRQMRAGAQVETTAAYDAYQVW